MVYKIRLDASSIIAIFSPEIILGPIRGIKTLDMIDDRHILYFPLRRIADIPSHLLLDAVESFRSYDGSGIMFDEDAIPPHVSGIDRVMEDVTEIVLIPWVPFARKEPLTIE